jgi:hypothetical protein
MEAELGDIIETIFSENTFTSNIEIKKEVTTKEVLSFLRTRRANKAPGLDSILNKFLKAIGKPLVKALTTLIIVY